MTGTLYINNSDRRVIGKNLTGSVALSSIQLLDECSIISPTFIITNNSTNLARNYLYVSALSRYYYINNITIIDSSRLKIDCSVDVLESFKTSIKALTCTIKRNSYTYNKYLDDPLYQVLTTKEIVTKKFSTSPFTNSALSGTPCFVITTVGGVSNG